MSTIPAGVLSGSMHSRSVVRLGPLLDVRAVGLARNALDAAVRAATGDVVVDMSEVESIDATGLGMLTVMHLRCERRGARLILQDCSREVRRVLAVTRLNRVLHVSRTSELADELVPG